MYSFRLARVNHLTHQELSSALREETHDHPRSIRLEPRICRKGLPFSLECPGSEGMLAYAFNAARLSR